MPGNDLGTIGFTRRLGAMAISLILWKAKASANAWSGSNHRLAANPRAEREAVESRLRIELDKTAARYDAAKQNYQAALKLHDELGLGHADGAHAVRSALQQETAA